MVEGKKVWNFSAGPCVLPKEVIQQAQDEIFSWHGSGVSALEMSHRSKEFIEIHETAEKDFRDLMGVPKNYKIFFFQGGATLQFSAIPYNLLQGKDKANYLTSGAWSQGAIAEAKKLCTAVEAWPDSGNKFTTLPDIEKWNIDKSSAYFHYCDNETIHGVEFQEFPYEAIGDLTLVSDMSSNFATRPIHWDKYGVVYGGAQKNLGPAGVTVSVIRDDLIGKQRADTPLVCDWNTYAKAPQTYHNTPVCYSIYVTGLNIAHMKKNGLKYYEDEAHRKSKLLYDFIDGSNDYYSNPVDKRYRSRLNIPFRVKKDEALENKFVAEAAKHGLVELKGHRSVGGCRASIYNAMSYEGVEALVNFMKQFMDENH